MNAIAHTPPALSVVGAFKTPMEAQGRFHQTKWAIPFCFLKKWSIFCRLKSPRGLQPTFHHNFHPPPAGLRHKKYSDLPNDNTYPAGCPRLPHIFSHLFYVMTRAQRTRTHTYLQPLLLYPIGEYLFEFNYATIFFNSTQKAAMFSRP